MAKGFKHGIAGTALNFRVLGGTVQPENQRENTIWVSTATDLSGWVFSPEEPESPSGGLVWIALGTASRAPFNALKKNGLFVYPLFCKQYVSGAWETKTAYVYKAGTWEQVMPVKEYLIQDGAIDLDAHPCTVTENASSGTYPSNGVTYHDQPALHMGGRNGAPVTYSYADVTVPDFASVFSVEIYYIPAYNADPVISIGEASLTIDRGSAQNIQNKTVSIDVSAISGQAVDLKFRFTGCAYNDFCYIGNAWFE